MASHLKDVKKSTLTDEMRKVLCEYKNEHPSSSQKDLQQWIQQTFDLSVSQSIISNTLKRSSEYLSKEIKNNNVKMHKSAKYPELEKVLYEWFLQYQEKVNMTGEMIQTKAKEFLQKMYGDSNSKFNFSIGWLERFKARHGIKSYRRFGESDSVVMENIEDALPQIRAKLENFCWEDIYNMDETDLFYRLQADHSLGTKQLEGRKKDKERLTVVVCCNGDGSDKVPLWVIKISDVEGVHKLKEVISDLHYRNAMNVEQILNYPSENESLMESPTDEEIIQGVMDVLADDEQYSDDSNVLSRVSPKETFLVVDILKNYLIQYEKNIPDLVYALLKVKDEIVFDSHAKKKHKEEIYRREWWLSWKLTEAEVIRSGGMESAKVESWR
ncbi:hypothetical protein Gotur_010404 [Gossypium turneri]